MDFKTYSIRCQETKVFHLHTDDPIEYCVIALAGEMGELSEKIINSIITTESVLDINGVLQESGDSLWYLCQLCEYLGSNLDRVINSYPLQDSTLTPNTVNVVYTFMSYAAKCGDLSNTYKKVLRGDYTLENTRGVLLTKISFALYELHQLVSLLGSSLYEIAEMNIEKLASRKLAGSIQGDGDIR